MTDYDLATHGYVSVSRLAKLSGLDDATVLRLLRRYRLRRTIDGMPVVFLATLRRLAPDLYHAVAFLLDATRKPRGRPRGFREHYRKPGPKPK